MNDLTKTPTLQAVAKMANAHYWDAHALLMSAKLMAEKLDSDGEWVLELCALLDMASLKVLDIQTCFNPFIQIQARAELNLGEVAQ